MKRYTLKMTDTVPVDWSNIERAEVACYPWGGGERAYKTYGQLAYAKTGDEKAGLYIHMFCEEQHPVSKETRFNGPVCMDSCMEFFFGMYEATAPSERYLNFESNSLGVTYISFGERRGGRVFLDDLGIERFPVSVQIGNDGWEVFAFVSEVNLKKIFGLEDINENIVMKGNFYKCDENANAPFGCWAPIVAPKPDFHRPEFFGEIVIAK